MPVPHPVIATLKLCPLQVPLQDPLVAHVHPAAHVTVVGDRSHVVLVKLLVIRSVPPFITRLLRASPVTVIAEVVVVVTL